MFLTKYLRRRREKRYFRLLEDAFHSIDGVEELQDHDKTSVVVRALNSKLSQLLGHKKVKNVSIGKTQLKPAFNPRTEKFMKCVSMEVTCDYECCASLKFTMTNCTGRWIVNFTKIRSSGHDYKRSYNFEDFYDLNQIP